MQCPAAAPSTPHDCYSTDMDGVLIVGEDASRDVETPDKEDWIQAYEAWQQVASQEAPVTRGGDITKQPWYRIEKWTVSQVLIKNCTSCSATFVVESIPARVNMKYAVGVGAGLSGGNLNLAIEKQLGRIRAPQELSIAASESQTVYLGADSEWASVKVQGRDHYLRTIPASYKLLYKG